MSKRQQKSRRKSQHTTRAARPERQPPDLDVKLRKATELLDSGRPHEAVALVAPLVEKHPRVAALHHTLAAAYALLGNLWASLAGFERAQELTRDPFYWDPLARLYLQLEMNSHALHAFRQILRRSPRREAGDATLPATGVGEAIAFLEDALHKMALGLDIPISQAEQGLYHLEDGNRALHRGDYTACADANRKAIRLLGDWPPPHNNLSLALFLAGSPDEAITTARRVLSHDPANIQALSNLIRFLAWTGRREEAQTVWGQLATIAPRDASDHIKIAEAAAMLDQDQAVYDLLWPVVEQDFEEEIVLPVEPHARFLLAVAEANLRKPEAARRLEEAQVLFPTAAPLLKALKAGRPGPGFSDRFPYFGIGEMLFEQNMEELMGLIGRQDKLPERQFRKLMDRFLARFPQAVLVAEKLLWEGEQPEGAVLFLAALGNAAAHAALRRFALSQAGSDSMRIDALHQLARAGVIKPSDTLRVWADGEWRDVQMRSYAVLEQDRPQRDPQTADLLRRGEEAYEAGDERRAEDLFARALKRDPRATEALNNLGAIYAHRGDHAQARQMYQAALDVDPDYVFPRCNLAAYLLDDGDVEAAEAMLAPLAQRAHFRPREMAYYSYVQARIHAEKDEHDAARSALEMALQVDPSFEPAQNMLTRFKLFSEAGQDFESYFERMRQRDRARRRRLQARLASREPRLAEALPLYSREVLANMAKLLWPYQSWSGLRKAELLAELVERFQQPSVIDRAVAGLNEVDRTALQHVLAQGGQMPWSDFDARFGNDLEESAYWNWHEPETTMGGLRRRGLLVEATVDGELLVTVPRELRQPLAERLGEL